MLNLRKALASGQNAKLVRMFNEDCAYPITQKLTRDVRNIDNWNSSHQTLWAADEIINNQYLSADEKYMMLNYVQVFGTDEAIEHYRSTGELTAENVRGMGTCHYVKRKDMIQYLIANNEMERATCFDLSDNVTRRFTCNFHLKPEHTRIPKKFKCKLWVVAILKNDEPKPKIPAVLVIINVLLYPLKYIPTRSVLRMNDYKCITYRIGDVTNGFGIEFHIPKKFSFK